MQNIGRTLSNCIKESKWADITYQGLNKVTHYWICVKDIEEKSGKIICNIANLYDPKIKKKTIENTFIFFNKILTARKLDNTYYNVPDFLIAKLTNINNHFDYMEYDSFNNNILEYIKECYEKDKDPYQKSYDLIKGIDCETLSKNKSYKLSDLQIDALIHDVFNYDERKIKFASSSLVINVLSISMAKKVYVVAYRKVDFDVLNRKLKMDGDIVFNKTFLGSREDDTPMSLKSFIDCEIDEFIAGFTRSPLEYTRILQEGLYSNQKINTEPYLMLLERDFKQDMSGLIDEISVRHKNGELNAPLQAFFGDFSTKNLNRRRPKIAIIDDRANIDQVAVVFNAMKNPITYVKGPPGTGKTQTILNIILSAFVNERTCLICSNNNKPINGICEKIDDSFMYKGTTHVPFPFLRIGKKSENLNAMEKIKKMRELSANIEIYDESLANKKTTIESKYSELSKLLEDYEKRNSFVEFKKTLINWENTVEGVKLEDLSDHILRQIKETDIKIENIPQVTNKEVLDKAFNAKEDSNFQQFIYFTSFKYIKRLNKPEFNELFEICNIKSEDERNAQFNSYIRDDNNFKKLQKVFPFICTTNFSANKLGNLKVKFDLCIMDEAGQCDIANALFSFVRCKELVLIGDVNQLEPVIVLDETINKNLMQKYQISPDYNYCKNSILKLMTNKDRVSKNILLEYHYRCGKKIIDFSNKLYYKNSLHIETKDLPNQIEHIDVKNKRNPNNRNCYIEEAATIVNVIKNNNYHDCGIITPFRNQAALINEMLIKNGIQDVKAGTIHSLQGDEKDVIILSTSIARDSSAKTYEWIRNNRQLINVATTRPKKKLIMVGDFTAIQEKGNRDDQIIKLVDYVLSNGTKLPSPIIDKEESALMSNDSKNEMEMLETLNQIISVHNKHKRLLVKQGIPLSAIVNTNNRFSREEKEYIEHSVLDFVIYKKGILGPRVILVMELDGPEHINDKVTIKRDRLKEHILNVMGTKLIRVSNRDTKDYERIKLAIMNFIGGISDKEDIYENLLNF